MMGRLERDQEQLFYSFCLEEVVPDDHQVRAISAVLGLSWVYGELSPHYPALGRASIDPVLMIRMLILGYAFGLEAGIFPGRLALIEYGSDFVRILQQRFPEVHVLWMDAARLRDVTLFGWGETGAVVSGLPLLSMPPRKVMAILEGAFTHLRPSGALYQFTYWPHCPISERILDRLDLRAVHCGTALANIPPAYVYRIVRKRSRPVRSPHRVHAGIDSGSDSLVD